MTPLPIRPKDTTLALAIADDDIVVIDGSAGVRRVTFATLRSLLVSSFATGMTFKGAVAGDSVPNSSAAAGDYYLVNANGTSQGKDWVAGDFALYNGSGWDKLEAAWLKPISNAVGSGEPEGVVTGIYEGQTYVDRDTGTRWSFLGTPGENTGWV